MPLLDNLRKLEESDPELVEKLRSLDPSTLTLIEARSGELNLCDELHDDKRYIHSNYSPSKEMARWWDTLDLGVEKVLYVYGVGLGYIYDIAKQWLEEDSTRFLVLLEDDFRAIYRLLETERGTAILDDEQVLFARAYPDDERNAMLTQDLALSFVGLPFVVKALPYHETHRAEAFLSIHRHFMHAAAFVHFAGGEFMNYGVAFFRNFFRNMRHLDKTTGCRTMVDGFKNVPAIICGAGPSLNKNIDLLKELEDRALIFAGGSAINALTNRGINPHFGGSIDPNIMQAERMGAHRGFELPIFIKGRTHFQALEQLHGPKIYLSGNNMYPITLWMEQELGINELPFTEGHNVLHLLIDIATRFGCNPIIFVGMDLGFTGMKSYAEAVIKDAEVSEEEITEGSDLNQNAFLREDINGQPIYTLWKWVAESQHTAFYASHRPEIRYINCTEGGLGFEGIPNRTLREVMRSELTRQYDLRNWVHQELEASRFPDVTREKVIALFQKLDDSFERCYELTGELADSFQELGKEFQNGSKQGINSVSEKIEDLHKQLADEVACRYILEPVNQVRSVIYERQFKQIGYDKEVRSDLERMLKRCEQNREEMFSLRECTELNQALLRKVLEEEQVKA